MPELTPAQVTALAKIPTLIMFGDHPGDVQVMHLPTMGIKGNSHVLVRDRNHLDLADLILPWIDRHADTRGACV